MEGEREQRRLALLRLPEVEPLSRGFCRIAGVDEAGRGPLAGPVVAAACHIPTSLSFAGIDDSKRLTPKQRSQLAALLISHPGVIYGIGEASAAEIDALNIRQATLLAMRRAVDAMPQLPDYLLVDGCDDPAHKCPATAIVKGDALSLLIAAASILAKAERDRQMEEVDARWPCYGFAQHKGYPTAAHLEALRLYGPSPLHRRSFGPVARHF